MKTEFWKRIFSCAALPLLACNEQARQSTPRDLVSQALASSVMEAEALALSGSAVRVYSDGAASAGKAVRFYSAGSVKGTLSGATSRVSLRARSALCDGAPNADLYVDGTLLASQTVATTTYSEFSIQLALGTGPHQFELRYTNDTSTSSCDRDLIVDSLTWTEAPGPVVAANPFAGETLYVDPNSAARRTANEWAAGGRPDDADDLEKIAGAPRPVRYFSEWTEDEGTGGVRLQVSRYIAAVGGALPVMGAYAILYRDCSGGHSSGGFETAEQYEHWIDEYAAGIGQRKAVIVLEPDALPGIECLRRNVTPEEGQRRTAERIALLKYAVEKFEALDNTYVYIDAGHSAWKDPSFMIEHLKQVGIELAAGFATNNANFNFTEDEIAWGEEVSAGIGDKHFIIDTSRNGAGPYTEGTHSGDCADWANPPDRGLGARPTANTGHPLVDAFFWLKTPGASDGKCGPFPDAGTWLPEYALGLCRRAAD